MLGSIGVSKYLVYISIIPAVLLILFAVASAVGMLTKKAAFSKLMLGLAITVGGYFLGAVAGYAYQATKDHGGDSHAAANVELGSENIHLVSMTIDEEEKADADHDQHGHDKDDHGHEEGDHGHGAEGGHGHDGHGHDHVPVYDKHHPDPDSLSDDVRIFFSIYYCMTGLHAIHIIAGIIALALSHIHI